MFVSDPTIFLLCMKRKCPPVLLLSESTLYKFQCYSDQIKPSIKYEWKLNNENTGKGVEERHFLTNESNEHVTVDGSELSLFVQIGDENILCSLGNISKFVNIQGKFYFRSLPRIK